MNLSESRVALVGRRLEHNENLGLCYLRAALRRAGVAVDTYYVNDPDELVAALGAIRATRPQVVGLSLADGGSAMLQLALGEALAEGGYGGHVTAGGQFATLAREWLLERHAWLDSVVRFAGERPIVEIARRVAAGRPVAGIPGVTTRGGDGEPSSVLDLEPLEIRPERDELPEILGHAAAHMAASRGCLGRCQYCGPAALHTLERREGIRAGVGKDQLTAAGVGGVRRRELDATCDEMAELWHERGVRYFYFVDEHLLPYTEPEALEYLRSWKAGLAARKVGAFGIGTMLRADRLTSKIVRAFVELGLVRVFVGLELATEVEGRRFGRRPPGARELALLDDFADAGVVTVSNLMLVNPYSTPETLRAGIDFLADIPRGVFEATRMMVYHGTRLMKTMQAEGRLIGNPFRYGYTFADPRVERFAEIFSRLRAEAFWNYSVAFRTHDAFLALALASRVHPERVAPELRGRLERTRRAVNHEYVWAYRNALALALDGGGFDAAGPLIAALRPRVLALELELDALEQRLQQIAPRRGRAFAPMRSAAAGVLSFAVAACGNETPRPESPEPVLAAPPAEKASEPVNAPDDAGEPEAVSDAAIDVPAASATNECSASELAQAEKQVKQILGKSAACFAGNISLGDPPSADFQVTTAYGINRICSVSSASAHESSARQALHGKLQSCLRSGQYPEVVRVDGNAQREANAASKALASCNIPWQSQVQVMLDTKGRVTRVVSTPPGPHTLCIQKVLRGLSFPCLSSFEVCPEHVIIE